MYEILMYEKFIFILYRKFCNKLDYEITRFIILIFVT